jgi:pyruvate/2-oxoglutarate/acetoin dehydrogenase E1 component
VPRLKTLKKGYDMPTMTYADAIEDALAVAMAVDPRIVVFGEDAPMLHRNLLAQFGAQRVRATPISEAAFVGAAVGAALGGMRPVVDVMIVDFIAVAIDALLNHASKIDAFSGGRWRVPLVVRSACGGGYGDGGQHEQSLWGWLAHIPGLNVVVPSNPADAGGLMLSAIEHDGPVIFLEHKLLAATWLRFLGSGGRRTVTYDVPAAGARGPVPKRWKSIPLGQAAYCREGSDLTLISIGVGVHRCLEAAQLLAERGLSAGVIDLRSVAPLDRDLICDVVSKTGHMVVVDEDYRDFGLSGELAATVVEAGISVRYARVCVEGTLPYSRQREEAVLPSTPRIVAAAQRLLEPGQ